MFWLNLVELSGMKCNVKLCLVRDERPGGENREFEVESQLTHSTTDTQHLPGPQTSLKEKIFFKKSLESCLAE